MSRVDTLAAHCSDYTGDPIDRARLLPRVLRQLGYDVGTWIRVRPGERVFARHPSDTEFVQAPELLDDLQAIALITPEPFELIGSEANRTDNPPIVWAARIRSSGDFMYGKRPAATLAAALLLFTRHPRRRMPVPPLHPVYPATVTW